MRTEAPAVGDPVEECPRGQRWDMPEGGEPEKLREEALGHPAVQIRPLHGGQDVALEEDHEEREMREEHEEADEHHEEREEHQEDEVRDEKEGVMVVPEEDTLERRVHP